MSESLGAADSLGFEDLGYIGPPPPDARLIYCVDYGWGPLSELERRELAKKRHEDFLASRPQQPPKPSKPRKPTLASVAKQANKAAITVARYEVKPDGTIAVITGQGEQQQGNEVDEWIAKHADKTQGH